MPLDFVYIKTKIVLLNIKKYMVVKYIKEKEKVQQVIKYVLIINGDYVEQTKKFYK